MTRKGIGAEEKAVGEGEAVEEEVVVEEEEKEVEEKEVVEKEVEEKEVVEEKEEEASEATATRTASDATPLITSLRTVRHPKRCASTATSRGTSKRIARMRGRKEEEVVVGNQNRPVTSATRQGTSKGTALF